MCIRDREGTAGAVRRRAGAGAVRGVPARAGVCHLRLPARGAKGHQRRLGAHARRARRLDYSVHLLWPWTNSPPVVPNPPPVAVNPPPVAVNPPPVASTPRLEEYSTRASKTQKKFARASELGIGGPWVAAAPRHRVAGVPTRGRASRLNKRTHYRSDMCIHSGLCFGCLCARSHLRRRGGVQACVSRRRE
eukprot:1195447-Prorocentrum_minimum.AAC.1